MLNLHRMELVRAQVDVVRPISGADVVLLRTVARKPSTSTSSGGRGGGAFDAAAVVGDASGVLHQIAVGAQTYDAGSTPFSVDSTYFDVASLTKVTVTTTAAMLLYQWGALDLQMRVAQILGRTFASIVFS